MSNVSTLHGNSHGTVPDTGTQVAPGGSRDFVRQARGIARVCVPVSLGSALGLATTVVVTALIGRMGGSALYVRSVYAPLSFVLNAVTVGAAVPLQVRTARTHQDATAVQRGSWLGSSARVVIACGVLVGLICALTAPLLAGADGMPARFVSELREFVALMALSVTINAVGELCAAMVRGSGATAAGTVMTICGAGTTIAFIAIVGVGAGAGLLAVPFGYALGGLIEIGIGCVLLVRRRLCALGGVRCWDRAVVGYIQRIGVPVAASFLLLFVENSLLLHIVSGHGRFTVEGFSAAMTIQTLVIVPAAGFASGLAILMNQTSDLRGARAELVYRRGLQLLGIYYAIITVVLVLLPHQVANVMIGGSPSTHQLYVFLRIVGPSLGLTAIALATMTILEETGFGRIAVLLNLMYFVEVIVIGWVLTHTTGSVTGLYAMMTFAGGLAGLIAPGYVRHILRTKKAR